MFAGELGEKFAGGEKRGEIVDENLKVIYFENLSPVWNLIKPVMLDSVVY